MVLRHLLKALFVFAVLCFAGQVQAGIAAPAPIVSETVDPGGLSGRYTVHNPADSGVSVFGFAIENNLATSTATSRLGWVSGLATAELEGPGIQPWDGFEITFDDVVLFKLGDLGDFNDIFGDDATQAAVYWNFKSYS